MLKRINRIFSRKEFGEVKAQGMMMRGEMISCLVLKKDDNEKRVGVIVSKKISNKAVVRNKIRRLIYEAVKVNLEKINKGVRLVFLVNQQIVGKNYEEVSIEVFKVLQKIHF